MGASPLSISNSSSKPLPRRGGGGKRESHGTDTGKVKLFNRIFAEIWVCHTVPLPTSTRNTPEFTEQRYFKVYEVVNYKAKTASREHM